jgi:hypothetical protein
MHFHNKNKKSSQIKDTLHIQGFSILLTKMLTHYVVISDIRPTNNLKLTITKNLNISN